MFRRRWPSAKYLTKATPMLIAEGKWQVSAAVAVLLPSPDLNSARVQISEKNGSPFLMSFYAFRVWPKPA
ncbi:MAG: hypothetical protein R6U17_08935 [Thermoplasmata archaeon]